MNNNYEEDYNQGYNYDNSDNYGYANQQKRKSKTYHQQQDSAYKLPDNGDNFNWNEYYGVNLEKNQQNDYGQQNYYDPPAQQENFSLNDYYGIRKQEPEPQQPPVQQHISQFEEQNPYNQATSNRRQSEATNQEENWEDIPLDNRESVKSKNSLESKKSQPKSIMSEKRKSENSVKKPSIVEK